MAYSPPVYPTDIPTIADLPDRADLTDIIYAARYNELKKELRAALTELGTLPKGTFADVTTRLGVVLYKTTSSKTYYVDGDNGTDDQEHGSGTGTNAFATIQYAINQVPKYLAHSTFIYVADCVYSITSAITIEGFVGYGYLFIRGSVSTIPAIGHYVIDTGANNITGFSITGCSALIMIQGFYIDSDTQLNKGINCLYNHSVQIKYTRVHNFYIGAYLSWGFGEISVCDLDDNDYGIYVSYSTFIFSMNNISSTTNDAFGMTSHGSTICKSGTQSTGAGGDEHITGGGEIR